MEKSYLPKDLFKVGEKIQFANAHGVTDLTVQTDSSGRVFVMVPRLSKPSLLVHLIAKVKRLCAR